MAAMATRVEPSSSPPLRFSQNGVGNRPGGGYRELAEHHVAAKAFSRPQQVFDLQRFYCQAQKLLTFHLPTEIQIPLGSVNK
jgi:hypothetical protein